VADAVTAEALRAASDGQPLDGVTLTSGEPLEQPEALAAFATRLKQGRFPGAGQRSWHRYPHRVHPR
jgi:hypothetical protein